MSSLKTNLCLLLMISLSFLGCGEAPKPETPETPATPETGAPAENTESATGESKTEGGKLTIYLGRKTSFAEPLIEAFKKKTGIDVVFKANKSGDLVKLLLTEKENTSADLFWAQDSGSLGATAKAGLFSEIPEKASNLLPEKFRTSKSWIAISGRARVLAYAPSRVKAEELPKSIFDLTDAKWKGRIGWAPTNSSFQAFVTAMRKKEGEEKTKAWLTGMKANEPKIYPKNTPIIQALADGEIDAGIPNHYYLLRFKAEDANFPVDQTFFADGDIGNMVNLSGVGILKYSENQELALQFIEFLLSEEAQGVFTNKVFEYPLVESVKPHASLVSPKDLQAKQPELNLSDLDDMEGTLKLLKESGVLQADA